MVPRPFDRTGLPDQALLGLAAFTALAIVGYAVFGLHPGRAELLPMAREFLPVSFQFFGRAHAALALAVLVVALVHWCGRSWLAAFVAVYLVALAAEFSGTSSGLPFGAYRYTDLLGWKIGDRVPALIPASWFVMAVPAYRLVATRSRAARVAGVVGLMLVWDLALDPAMSALTPYWIWEDRGLYYGMPWINLFGWSLTSAVIVMALDATGGVRWVQRLPVRWALAFYGTVLAMPVGMTAAAGAWGVVLCTAVAAAAVAALIGARSPQPSPA